VLLAVIRRDQARQSDLESIRNELINGYSYRSASIGAIRDARRAGR
jgi:hypothetical protein